MLIILCLFSSDDCQNFEKYELHEESENEGSDGEDKTNPKSQADELEDPAGEPENPTEEPENPTEEPDNQTEEPDNPTEEPENPTGEPENPTDKPGDVTTDIPITEDDEKEASDLMKKMDEEMTVILQEAIVAQWTYYNDMTAENKKAMVRIILFCTRFYYKNSFHLNTEIYTVI